MKDENKTKKQLIDELAELRGRKDAFQEIAEQSADIICTTDLSGRITYWSPGGEKLLGYAAEDALGNRVAGYYQGGDEEARALMVRLQQEGQILNYELTLRKKDGGLMEGSTSLSLLLDEDGTVIGTLGIVKDITQQKQAEEALRKEKERSDALYQVSNRLAGVHATDEVLDLIVNEAARLLGTAAVFLRLVKEGLLVPGPATATAAALQADSAQATPAFKVDKNSSSVGYVMATKEPLVMEDVATAEQISPEQRDVLQRHNIHGSVGVPLLANDQSTGVLFAVDHRIRRFTDDEVSLLTAFADQASLALEKARLLNEAEQERESVPTPSTRSPTAWLASTTLMKCWT